MTNKYEDWLVSGGGFPGLDIEEVELPKGVYVCMACHQISDYWEPGLVCARCEYEGEFQMEQGRGN